MRRFVGWKMGGKNIWGDGNKGERGKGLRRNATS
jgi:hypothetical protein